MNDTHTVQTSRNSQRLEEGTGGDTESHGVCLKLQSHFPFVLAGILWIVCFGIPLVANQVPWECGIGFAWALLGALIIAICRRCEWMSIRTANYCYHYHMTVCMCTCIMMIVAVLFCWQPNTDSEFILFWLWLATFCAACVCSLLALNKQT